MPKALTTVWTKLTGYKTLIGLLITLLAFLSTWIPQAMAAVDMNPTLTAQIVGAVVAVVGLLHKGYRLLFGEEAPK